MPAYDALTVLDQKLPGVDDNSLAAICQKEDRILITLDMDFADVRSYPPSNYPGFMVFRLEQQDKPHVLSVFQAEGVICTGSTGFGVGFSIRDMFLGKTGVN